MRTTIILKECNKKDKCGIEKCIHNKPHRHEDTCNIQHCDIRNFGVVHCRCLNHQYELVERG